ncbi:hypothetical protein F750_6031 [Streptomyces sp. PAMC 26508]|nr:hypothetical protein F750_6031 [Streptomyces sp. PAMC 26508]
MRRHSFPGAAAHAQFFRAVTSAKDRNSPPSSVSMSITG